MSKIRIGIDASNLRRGGGRTHLIEFLLAADLVRDQIDSIIVWGSRQTLDLLFDAPWLEKVALPILEKGLLKRTLWQRFSLGKLALMTGCNVLFVPGGNFTTRFRPIVTMSRNMLPFEKRELSRYGFSFLTLKLLILRYTQTRSFQAANGVIFLTDYAKQIVLSVTGQLPGETKVIPHGLNSRFLIPVNSLSSRAMPDKSLPIRLIYVSIIDIYKHQWHVVKGVSMARASLGLDLQLDLIGPYYAPALQKLHEAIAKYDPNCEWVNYHGARDYQELDPLYGQAHIGIFASSCENMPNILLEMMGAGLPILSSDRGPMPEILGNSGLYFNPEKPEELNKVIIELLSSKRMMQHFSKEVYNRAMEFSWTRSVESTFKFITQVTKNYSKRNH